MSLARKKALKSGIVCKIKDWSEEVIYGAAYTLTDRAYAQMEKTGTFVRVALEPKISCKETPAALKRLFLRELSAQKLRWSIARHNQSLREHIVGLALRQAEGASQTPSAPVAPDLTDAEKKEIEQLIAEVEAEIKERHDAKQDPLNISATWEESRSGKS